MDLPMPTSEQLFPAGGQLVRGLGGINALNTQNITNKYLPLTTQAEAASKLAYANLMGPQFLAKMMGNPDLLANMKNPEQATKMLQQAAMGQGTGTGASGVNALTSPPPTPLQYMMNELMKKLHLKDNNALNNQSRQSQPQQSNSLNLNQPASKEQNANAGMSYDQNGNNVVSPPNELNNSVNNALTGNGSSASTAPNTKFAENAGDYAGTKKEREELGTARGKAIADLGKQYMQDVESMGPLNDLADLSQTPTFMNMRKDIPFFQDLQLKGLSKIGNPEQQRIIGKFMTDAKSAVANTVNSFNGRAMAKEFDFGNMLKVGDNDTLGVMLGKLESLKTFKEASMQRNEIARNLMKANHMDEGDAYRIANQQVDMNGIRKKIASQLADPIRMKNKKTGETKLISAKEYNDLLNQK